MLIAVFKEVKKPGVAIVWFYTVKTWTIFAIISIFQSFRILQKLPGFQSHISNILEPCQVKQQQLWDLSAEHVASDLYGNLLHMSTRKKT